MAETRWDTNKAYMLQEEAAGRESEDARLWLENWRMLGEPETQAAMTEAKKEVDTGFSDDNSEVTLYDPTSGRFNTYDTEGDPLAYNPSGDLSDWGYAFGERVLMDSTGEGYDDMTYRDQSGDKQGGLTAGFNPITPITGGGGGFTTGGGDRDAINRDRDTNIGPNGEIITAENNDPFVDRDPIAPGHPDWDDSISQYTGSDPFAGVQSGGVQSVGTAAPQATASRDNPLQGYESSSNKDYYQQQFQNMRAQQLGQQDAGNAAAGYQAPPQGELADPWANKNLPDVYVQGGQEGYDPNEMIFNEDYAGMSNAQIANKVSGLSVFDSSQKDFLSDVIGPNWNDSYSFSNNPELARSNLTGADSGYNSANKATMNTLFDQLTSPAGQLPTPGGQSVPLGYASPTNA